MSKASRRELREGVAELEEINARLRGERTELRKLVEALRMELRYAHCKLGRVILASDLVVLPVSALSTEPLYGPVRGASATGP